MPDADRREPDQPNSLPVLGSAIRATEQDPATGRDGDPDAEWSDYLAHGTMRNHWDRPWPNGEHAYYWYLSFAAAPAVVDLAGQVWAAIDRPELDPIPPTDLHMTLQRVAAVDEIAPGELAAILDRSRELCADLPPFRLTVGPVTGSQGAIRFTVQPWAPIVDLRRRLRAALADTIGIDRLASPEADFRPHIGVAYSNADLPVGDVAAVLAELRQLPAAAAHVDAVTLVDLARTDHAYLIQPTARIPLATTPTTAE